MSDDVRIIMRRKDAEALLEMLYAIRGVARSALMVIIVNRIEKALGLKESM